MELSHERSGDLRDAWCGHHTFICKGTYVLAERFITCACGCQGESGDEDAAGSGSDGEDANEELTEVGEVSGGAVQVHSLHWPNAGR